MALRKNNKKDFDKFKNTSTDVLGNKINTDPPKTDTLRSPVISGYNKGEMLMEGDLENYFSGSREGVEGGDPKNYPQLSVQDYSPVKEDKKGKYVVKSEGDNTGSTLGIKTRRDGSMLDRK